MLRLLLFLILLYLLLRLLRRPPIQGKASSRSRPKEPPRAQPRPPGGAPKVVDEMKPCPQCGTYNPTRLAYVKNELYFCDQRCHEAFVRRESRS